MHEDLISLLSIAIPDHEPQSDGFLEISGMAHYENVNSRIYAHFLNLKEHPSIQQSFLNALLLLIEQKSNKALSFQSPVAFLEVATNLQYRIDILIKDIKNRTAVIVENKIYHHLNNDLQNYWDHVEYPEENKIGVLLTLNPHEIPIGVADKFINITHSEWITTVKSNGLPFGIPSNYYQYINDFASTIDKLTKSYAMNEQAKFYFQHALTIIKAKETMDSAHSFLNDQMHILASKLGWSAEGSAPDWKYIWDKDNDLSTYFTIWYGPLVNEGEFRFSIIIELNQDHRDRMSELTPILENIEQYRHIEMQHKTVIKGKFVHFCVREYSIKMGELERFGEHIYELILMDFSEVILAIINHFDPNLNKSKWIQNFKSNASQN